MWDVRKLKEPVKSVTGFPTYFDDSNLVFSPDERYLALGTY